ncbi:MAG: thrombospondin type 3 repeat-containing protein [Dehalococcoidia bacterium]|nr:thrombospondin type 3 repeat-containing protein [Dehalococcoidia bacterium]
MHRILRDLRWLGTATPLLVLVAAVMVFARADQTFAATTFNPTGSACPDDETTATACDGTTAAGATSGITTEFNLPKGDVNFSGTINFTPPGWTIATDGEITDGALVATLEAGATLGLLGGACNGQLTPSFSMMDATTSAASTVTFTDGFKDADGDGVADAVTKYPDFLARTFAGLTPRARMYGQALVSGVDVSLNFLIFEPGTTIRNIQTDPKLGYPSVTVLQNIGDPDVQPAASAITDFCSPLTSKTTVYGTTQDNTKTPANEGGKLYRKNPAADGTYTYVTWASGLRDADGDGLENGLDTCPFNPDIWDPRVGSFESAQPGDSDGDRIPDNCDSSPNDPYPQIDLDQDRYLNTGDNCPQLPNGIDSEGTIIGSGNQKDSDSDSIGDACDLAGAGGIGKGPTVADGDVLAICGSQAIQIGAGGNADAQVLNRLPCGAGVADGGGGTTGASPTPTLAPGQTPAPTTGTTTARGTTTSSGLPGGADTGIGTLSPVATNVPAWAALATAVGGLGLLGGIVTMASRRVAARRRRQ